GISDVGVPKRMKKLAKMFYGRTAAYDDALRDDDRSALATALARNVRPDAGEWVEAPLLANYVSEASRQLAAQPTESIVAGTVAFPVAGAA
ncbi:ubiquinol-cytochrome C chaperone family protein, partial [Mesorhizobium sp.]|uniref:ubiquinol-cytochrome C chaperone family protein n=1 Tax=Mesorhizobium sp. TaxID=1871066 RepID=UPI0025D433D2